MLVYILLFIILLAGTIYEQMGKNDKLKKTVFIISILILGVVLSTRGLIGYDWYSYKTNFDKIPRLYEITGDSFKNIFFSYEIGFQIYTSAIKTIFNNYYFYTFVNTGIDFILIYFIIKRYAKYPIFSLLLFYGMFGLPLEVDMIRNVKAILLFTFSIREIEDRNFSRFLILNIIGFLFHYSAILYLPMYFILNRKWNKNILLGIFVLGNIYYLLDSRLMLNSIQIYTGLLPNAWGLKLCNYLSFIPTDFPMGITLFYVERVVIFVLAWCCYDGITKMKYGKIMVNSLCITLFLFLFFAEFSILALRLELLFVYSYWFIIPLVFYFHRRLILFWLFIFMCAFRLFNQLEFPGNKELYRYENAIIHQIDEKEHRIKVEDNAVYKIWAHGKEISVLF